MDFRISVFNDGATTFRIPYINVNNSFFFKARDIATTLGYADTKRAIQNHVDEDDKQKMADLLGGSAPVGGDSESPLDFHDRNTIYIIFSGLFSLSFRSDKPIAKQITKWVTSELLPTLMTTGSYSIHRPI